MKMNKTQFGQVFSRVDNNFVGSLDHVYAYQKKYTKYFTGVSGLVVDVGCGQGAFLKALAEEGFNYLGVDSDPQSIAACLAKGFKATQDDGRSFLTKHSQSLAGVFMAHIIEHYPGPKALQLIVECYEALVKGGVLVVITPNYKEEPIYSERFWLSTSHVRPYPVDWLRCALGEIGFGVLDSGCDPDFGDIFIVGIKS